MDDEQLHKGLCETRAKLVGLWREMPFNPATTPLDKLEERARLQETTDKLREAINSICRRNGWPEAH